MRKYFSLEVPCLLAVFMDDFSHKEALTMLPSELWCRCTYVNGSKKVFFINLSNQSRKGISVPTIIHANYKAESSA